MTESIERFLKIFFYGLLILTTVISTGTLVWSRYPLELLCHFRVYYLLLVVAIAIALSIWHIKGFCPRLPIYLALSLIAFNSVWIVPWYLPNARQASGDSIRVLTFNINVQNDRWDEIAKAIRDRQPDIATITESSIESKEELSQRLSDIFPFIYRTSGGGLTILSRFPLISPQSKTFDSGTILVTSLQIDRETVELIAAHPLVPLKPDLFDRRNALLSEISKYVRQREEKTLIFVGDLNITPWSPHYSRFIRETGLHNTRLGFGVEPSWVEAATHVRYPKFITTSIKIPIDHIFVSQGIGVADCKTMKAANSDHRMLWSDLVL
jgi:endonuclease/exonuclease/phosphatase (EEP) superfamily protein YafD